MINFSLSNDADRDALIAALKERGIEAFKSGFTTDICALPGGGVNVIAFDSNGVTQVYTTGPDVCKIGSCGEETLGELLDTFAALFGLLEQGDAGRYAAKADSSKTEAAT